MTENLCLGPQRKDDEAAALAAQAALDNCAFLLWNDDELP